MRGDCCSVTHRIGIPISALTQWTLSAVGLQLATAPECSVKIGDRQREKKWWECDQRAICNTMCGIGAGCEVIPHRGVSGSSDEARPPWRSYPGQMEIIFADVVCMVSCNAAVDYFKITVWNSLTSICSTYLQLNFSFIWLLSKQPWHSLSQWLHSGSSSGSSTDSDKAPTAAGLRLWVNSSCSNRSSTNDNSPVHICIICVVLLLSWCIWVIGFL